MDNYLYRHFKGQYRILPELDKGTNNFIKDDEFADFYIPFKNGKLKHATGNELVVYFDTKTTGTNFLKAVYKTVYEEEWKKSDDSYYSKLCIELMKNPNISEVEVLDCEVMMIFKTTFLNSIKKYLKLKTFGAGIEPFSVKNLPSRKGGNAELYTEEDNESYKKAIENVPLPKIKMINSLFIVENNIENPDKYRPKDIIKMSGLWDEYIKFIEAWKNENIQN